MPAIVISGRSAAQTRPARSRVPGTHPVVQGDAPTQNGEANRGAVQRIAGNVAATFDV